MRKVEIADECLTIFGKKFQSAQAGELGLEEVTNPALVNIREVIEHHDLAHFSPGNTTIYRTCYGGKCSLIFACAHFEDAYLENMMSLVHIMLMMAIEFRSGDTSIELLDTFAEKLIIEISDVDIGCLY